MASDSDRPSQVKFERSKVTRGLIVSVAFSLVVLVVVYMLVPDKDRTIRSLAHFKTRSWALAGMLLVGAWMADAGRLYLLTRGIGKPCGYPAALKAILAGNFITLITPFLFGGAPVVAYSIKKKRMTWGEATAVVVGGGIVSQSALLFLALWSVLKLKSCWAPFPWERLYGLVIPIYAAGLLVFTVGALRADLLERWLTNWLARRRVSPERGRIYRKIEVAVRRLIRYLKEFQSSLKLLASENAAYVIASFLCALAYFGLMFALGPVIMGGLRVRQPWLIIFALEVLVYVVAGLTPTPGGSGVAEFGSLYLLGAIAPVHVVGAFVVVWRFLTFYVSLLIGAVAFMLVLRDILEDA